MGIRGQPSYSADLEKARIALAVETACIKHWKSATRRHRSKAGLKLRTSQRPEQRTRACTKRQQPNKTNLKSTHRATHPTRTHADHARLTHEIELFYYTKRDSQVVTPIGWATVNSYREEDQMLIVTLPFCRPLARMWIPVEKVCFSSLILLGGGGVIRRF